MFTDFYLRIPKRVRIFIVFLLIVLVAFFVIRFLPAQTRSIPEEFLRARQEASAVASDIVFMSGESSVNIAEISKLDQEHNYETALNLVTQEIGRNREARGKAIILSQQLEAMAKNIAQITPASASQEAVEAVSSEAALISRLITYNDYLMQLLGLLQEKLLGRNNGDGISDLVDKINNEARAINDLNVKFNETMNLFDKQ